MMMLEIHARAAAASARLDDDGDFEQIKILKILGIQVKQPLVMQKKEPKDSSN